MKISLNWINDYIDLENENKKELANKITNTGINVEEVLEHNFNNLVVGSVKTCEKHPDSDHLSVCMVDVGKEELQIICGAPNIKVGQKVIVALIGAALPGGFEIKERVVRGVSSYGMICSLSEIGLESDGDGIHVLNQDAIVGESITSYIGIDDTLYTLDLNPNRNDCLSHIGFAYVISAILGKKVTLPESEIENTSDSINNYFTLEVETKNAPMYLARMVKDVKIGPSPDFIKQRLEAVGIRSINNVVDISNYVMLEYGQPLHFFDKDKLGNKIKVRMAQEGEKVTTLDGANRVLKEEDIVITDGQKIVGIAGVMGALNTEIENNTKDILIESAIFNPLKVRYTSIRLGLRSEASLRFEKGLNFEYTHKAIQRACYLLKKYAGGKVLKDTAVHDEIDKTLKSAEISIEKINKIIGINIKKEDISNIFERLGFDYIFKDDKYIITIPNRRMDVNIKEDLIEEVASIYGYEKLENIMPQGVIKKGSYAPETKFRKDISKRLRSLGLDEVKTYTLLDEKRADKFNYRAKEVIKLEKPMSNDKSCIRVSVIPSLLEVYNYNNARGVQDINIYEISNIYYKQNNDYVEELNLGILMKGNLHENTWNKAAIKDDFFTMKGIIESVISHLGLKKRCNYSKENAIDFMHPGMSADVIIDKEKVGFFGRLNPNMTEDNIYVCELSLEKLFEFKPGKIKFIEPNKYPSVKRDLAFILDCDINASEIVKEIIASDNKRITECKVFDEYKMGEKKSLAFSITFEDYNKTLTEEEINETFQKIISNITKKYNAILRDK